MVETGKIYKQKCGDSVKVISCERRPYSKGTRAFFTCEFQKYPYTVIARAEQIEGGTLLNPEIENHEFIGQKFHQNCGDDLIVLKKIEKKEKGGHVLYECEFVNYPSRVIRRKDDILRGMVINPQIEQITFVEKLWPQPNNHFLKPIEKTNKKHNNDILWKASFEDGFIIEVEKNRIIDGYVLHPKDKEKYDILKSKEVLLHFIQENFSYKPTYIEVAEKANISRTSINNKILEYSLRDFVNFPEGSKGENNLRDYIKQIYPNTEEKSNWKVLDGKEIDIFIPDKNLGFEYNGNFWHCNEIQKNEYHQEKSLLAQSKGIKLIHIWEWELNEKESLIKDFIKSQLGIFERKIYARLCQIKELKNIEYQNFCNKNHLQGERGAKVKLGLFYENELVQIMSFGVPIFTEKYEWEIVRECSKSNYLIIGGKEKLWSYFVKNYSPKSVISYCDFSKFNGNSYLKLDFKKIRLNKPGFWWYNHLEGKVYWRNPYKHQEMKKKGYYKLYDAGQLVFVWNNKI